MNTGKITHGTRQWRRVVHSFACCDLRLTLVPRENMILSLQRFFFRTRIVIIILLYCKYYPTMFSNPLSATDRNDVTRRIARKGFVSNDDGRTRTLQHALYIILISANAAPF